LPIIHNHATPRTDGHRRHSSMTKRKGTIFVPQPSSAGILPASRSSPFQPLNSGRVIVIFIA
jgi:hypothetical protein